MLLTVLLLVFSAAMLSGALRRMVGSRTEAVFSLATAGLFVYFLTLLPSVLAGTPLREEVEWIPRWGVSLSMSLDGLSLLFVLLITGIGAFVLLYAGSYLHGDPGQRRFTPPLLLFMGSMLGVVMADDLITLFLFWELTSISSYFLIGYHHEDAQSRASALQALLVTGLGGLAMLAGFLLLGGIAGGTDFPTLLSRSEAIRQHALYAPALLLVLAGAFTKSAQFPFHFWLPNAMAAPSPVSAYLHSATMVKAGVYLMARLSPVLGGTELWQTLLIGVGGTTMVLGAILSYRQRDLKRILAMTTVSALGTLTFLIGIGTPLALFAAALFILVHALYKAALFLLAGILDHETGTRDAGLLSGLRSAMPWSTTAGLLAGLSMAGLLPFVGFVGKELMIEAALGGPLALVLILLVTNLFAVSAAWMTGIRPFIGTPASLPRTPHDPPLSMLAGPLVLGLLGLGFGILPDLAGSLVRPAASAMAGSLISTPLALWHGLTPMLAWSLVTLALGAAAALGWFRLRGVSDFFVRFTPYGPDAGYRTALAAMLGTARGSTRLLQAGYLRWYVLFIVGSFVLMIGIVLLPQVSLPLSFSLDGASAKEGAIVAAILLGAALAVGARSGLTAILGLGVVGYGIAMIFLLFSAPDLAMTQFAIETLTVILFVLVIARLPRFARISRMRSRMRDAAVALSAGAMVTMLMLAVIAQHTDTPLSAWFTENSLPLGKGRNIVNVILVDFRALDTLGEITVLAIASIGVAALLASRHRRAS